MKRTKILIKLSGKKYNALKKVGIFSCASNVVRCFLIQKIKEYNQFFFYIHFSYDNSQ